MVHLYQKWALRALVCHKITWLSIPRNFHLPFFKNMTQLQAQLWLCDNVLQRSHANDTFLSCCQPSNAALLIKNIYVLGQIVTYKFGIRFKVYVWAKKQKKKRWVSYGRLLFLLKSQVLFKLVPHTFGLLWFGSIYQVSLPDNHVKYVPTGISNQLLMYWLSHTWRHFVNIHLWPR